MIGVTLRSNRECLKFKFVSQKVGPVGSIPMNLYICAVWGDKHSALPFTKLQPWEPRHLLILEPTRYLSHVAIGRRSSR